MRKIAIISDIHGNFPALQEIVADIQRRNIDTVVNLGDHISGPLWPKETIQFLMGQPWIHISGNHDRQLVSVHPAKHGESDRYAYQFLTDEEKQWLAALPKTINLENEFFLFHGTPSSDSTYLLETIERRRTRLADQREIDERLKGETASLMFCGHTHIPRIVTTKNNFAIINPGSVGLQAYDDTVPEFHIVETGSPHTRYAVIEFLNDTWRAEQIALVYDHRKAAEQARKNNRKDWEIALRTGRMNE